MQHMRALVFVVVMAVSISASAAQTRIPNERVKPSPAVGIDDSARTMPAKEAAAPAVATLDRSDIIAYSIQHLDPWSILAANGSYKNCVKETSQETCFQRCQCGLNENNKKCGSNPDCKEGAALEKEACDAHCITDY